MILDWRARLLVLGFLTILYFMVSCLVTVTRMDARTLERRQDYILTQRKFVPHTFAGIMNNSESRKRRQNVKISWCKKQGLRSAPGPLVALASFPGSGNTWLRYLLQQATGLLTGSIYRDYALLKNGFPAESIYNNSVLAVKTHEYGPNARNAFDKAILLVRDPFPSVLAEFNRRSGGHIGHATSDKFWREKGKLWREFVRTKSSDWEAMNTDWAVNFNGPRLIIQYEDLCSDTDNQLRRVLDFLDIHISNKTMECVLQHKEGIYRRPKKQTVTAMLDNDMKTILKEKQDRVNNIINNTS